MDQDQLNSHVLMERSRYQFLLFLAKCGNVPAAKMTRLI